MSAPKGRCQWCGELVEGGQRAAYAVTGYERERDQGGANQIVRRYRVGALWHDRFGGDCFDLHLAGGNVQEVIAL